MDDNAAHQPQIGGLAQHMTLPSPIFDAEFEQFVSARQQRLVSTAYLITRDLHAAADLTQEALVRAYRQWRKTGMPAQPEAYVRTILLREHLTSRRRRSSTELVVRTEDLPEHGYENSTSD